MIHCSALLGYVEDILANAVITHPDLDLELKNKVVRAVNKVIWIQQDLFQRHYIKDAEDVSCLDKYLSLDRVVTIAASVAATVCIFVSYGAFVRGRGFAL